LVTNGVHVGVRKPSIWKSMYDFGKYPKSYGNEYEKIK
jgi:hypothetical protein